MDPMMASIQIFAGNFAPRGWAFCDGALLSISQYSALFSLLGTTYGGDGRTTFALPDLRGRAAIGPRHGPGLSSYNLGQRGGVETVTLNQLQIPSHTHTAIVNAGAASISGTVSATMKTNDSADTDSSDNTFLSNNGGGDGFAAAAGSTTLNPGAIEVDASGLSVNMAGLSVTNSPTGGSQYHENRPPYLAINYIIAMQGIYPSRN